MSHWLRDLPAQKTTPARSGLVATLNDPYLIAVVLFCLICLVVIAGRLRWNEWYVATHAAAVETPGQVIAGSREDAELQARSTFLFTASRPVRAPAQGRELIATAKIEAPCPFWLSPRRPRDERRGWGHFPLSRVSD